VVSINVLSCREHWSIDCATQPENVPAHFAAIMADAGTTAYKAVTHNVCPLLSLYCNLNLTWLQVKAGDRVLIYGVGGLGLYAVQFAKHVGATVYAVDMKPSSRALALEFGAEKAFDVQELQAAVGEGFTVDVAIDFVANDLCASNLPSEAKRDDRWCFSSDSVQLGLWGSEAEFAEHRQGR
jgi:D-arabinose 1-dehydrogenase-like Zn-dependent alcohol dehydrogenase